MLFAFLVMPLGLLVAKTLRETDVDNKVAWSSQDYKDGSMWGKALDGEKGYALDLHRMVKLPEQFWWVFVPRLMQWLVELWWERKRESWQVEKEREARLADVRMQPIRMERPSADAVARRRA